MLLTSFHPPRIAPSVPIPLRMKLAPSIIGEYARRALLTEVLLTPKPGLVDCRNSGAHDDMSIPTFVASIQAISAWFPRFVELGRDYAHVPAAQFNSLIRPTGLRCERAMLDATGGVNTHKGAIFALGLLCSAAGRLLAKQIELTRDQICNEVAHICKNLVREELSDRKDPSTAGELLFQRFGLTGARGEAASGYSTVRSFALPVYDELSDQGFPENVVLLQVLLHLFACHNDTNVVWRGGPTGLKHVQTSARNLLLSGGVLSSDGLERMAAFDRDLIVCNLSPGGSADMLTVTYFLARFPRAGQFAAAAPGRESQGFSAATPLSV